MTFCQAAAKDSVFYFLLSYSGRLELVNNDRSNRLAIPMAFSPVFFTYLFFRGVSIFLKWGA